MSNLKVKISESFSKAAEGYNDCASLQRRIAQQLVKSAKPHIEKATNILDLGSGTGFVAECAGKKIIQSDIALGMCKISNDISPTVCADMETLPFKDSSFELILSSSSLQWSDIQNSLKEAKRALSSGGSFIFSTFGYFTLADIRSTFKIANIEPKIHEFLSREEMETLIKNSGFEITSFDTEQISNEFNSLSDMLWSIKQIGAGAGSSKDSPLTKEKLILLEHIYRRNFNSEKIVANWEVFYFICKRSS